MDFLNEIIYRIQDAHSEEAEDSEKAPRNGETVVGKLDNDLKKIWAACQQMVNESNARVIEFARKHGKITSEIPPDVMKEFEHSADLWKEENEILQRIFWHSLKRHFDIRGEVSIAIRQDFQVVTYKDPFLHIFEELSERAEERNKILSDLGL